MNNLQISPELKAYISLRKDAANAWMFASPNSNVYPLADVLDQNELQDIVQWESRTGVRFGLLYESSFNRLLVDPIRDGRGGFFGYERMMPRNGPGGVVLLTRCKEHFILLRQFRHAIRREQYAFPRGFAEAGLSPWENAVKELQEELGITKVMSLERLGTVTPDSGLTGADVTVYSADIAQYSGCTGDEGILGTVELTDTQMREWIAQGRIDDGFTLAAYAMYIQSERCREYQ